MINCRDGSSCSWSRSLKEYIGEIAREAILHGVKYIALPNRHGCERAFWGIVVLSNLVFSIYTVNHFLVKFWNSPVITTFESQETRISRIPFPGITLCNLNVMKRSAMWEAKLKVDALMKKHETIDSKELQKGFIVVLRRVVQSCLSEKSFRRLINDTLFDAGGNGDFVNKFKDDLVVLEEGWNLQDPDNFIHVEPESARFVGQFMDQAAHKCGDMLQKCMFGGELTPCMKVFQVVYNYHGICCRFNWLPSSMSKRSSVERKDKGVGRYSDSNFSAKEISDWERFGNGDIIRKPGDKRPREYPHYQSLGGQQYGLSLLINPELDVYSTCTINDGFGFKLLTHSPISIPRVHDLGIGIPIGSEVFVNVEPIVTVANEENLKHTDVDVRGCYFPLDERAKLNIYNFYTVTNCMEECRWELTLKNCSCVLNLQRNARNQSRCTAKQFGCTEKVRVNLATTMSKSCSKCYPLCTEVKYRTHMSQFPLTQDALDAFVKKNGSNSGESFGIEASNYTILHVFFGSDSVHARERKMLYTALDIFAELGGALTLTLGVSIVSLFQIIYFCTLRAYFGIRSFLQKSDEKSPRLLSSAIVSSKLIETTRAREIARLCQRNQGSNNARPTKRINVRPISSNGVRANPAHRFVHESE